MKAPKRLYLAKDKQNISTFVVSAKKMAKSVEYIRVDKIKRISPLGKITYK